MYFIQAPNQLGLFSFAFEELSSLVSKTHPIPRARERAAAHSSARTCGRMGLGVRVQPHVFSTCASAAAAGEAAAVNREECRAASSQ